MPELVLRPGILKTESAAVAIDRYIDGDHVRFTPMPEKIGGWEKLFPTQLDGVPRALHAYLGPAMLEVRAVGTERRLYTVSLDGDVVDITPLSASGTLANDPFTTTDTTTTINVEHTAHGRLVGSIVIFDGAAAVGGVTIDGEYDVTAVVDANNYEVEHSAAATSTATGGGASVTYEYLVNPGTVSGASSVGYGVGPYGMEAYGVERTASFLTLDPRFWALDNYGDNLMGSFQNGTIYLYDADIDDRAQPLSGAPTNVVYSFVTEERFIFALCAAMRVKWPDQTDPTDWVPDDTNTANERTLAVGSKLVAGCALAQRLALVWTDTALYRFQYTGSEFVYESDLVGESCGLVGPGAFCTADGVAFWMGRSSFFFYAGSVQAIPNQEEISTWWFDSLSVDNRVKTTVFYNARFREVWFIAAEEGEDEPNRYVAVNIDSFHWTIGTLARVGETTQLGGDASPILASSDGYVYLHERADPNADGAALAWNLKTGLSRVPGATRSLDVFGFSPDFDRIVGNITLTVTGRDRPQTPEARWDIDEITLTDETEWESLRLEGRYFQFEFSQDEVDGDFHAGAHVYEVQPAGERP